MFKRYSLYWLQKEVFDGLLIFSKLRWNKSESGGPIVIICFWPMKIQFKDKSGIVGMYLRGSSKGSTEYCNPHRDRIFMKLITTDQVLFFGGIAGSSQIYLWSGLVLNAVDTNPRLQVNRSINFSDSKETAKQYKRKTCQQSYSNIQKFSKCVLFVCNVLSVI